jgi:hypothetical protein
MQSLKSVLQCYGVHGTNSIITSIFAMYLRVPALNTCEQNLMCLCVRSASVFAGLYLEGMLWGENVHNTKT